MMAIPNATGASISCKLQCGGFFELNARNSITEMQIPENKEKYTFNCVDFNFLNTLVHKQVLISGKCTGY